MARAAAGKSFRDSVRLGIEAAAEIADVPFGPAGYLVVGKSHVIVEIIHHTHLFRSPIGQGA